MSTNFTSIRFNHKNRVIEITTKKFYKSASIFGTEAYEALQQARTAYPNYNVVPKFAKTAKTDRYNGLTYSFIEQYIRKHDDDDHSKYNSFLDLRGLSAAAKEAGSSSRSYAEIKNWFFETFPEIESFENSREAILHPVKSC